MKNQSYPNKLQDLIERNQESEFFRELEEVVRETCLGLGFQDEAKITDSFERLWLPTALNLASIRQKLDRTFIQGILGGQGTGKSTLCIILKLILNYLGFSVANLSIDDLYLTHVERQELRQQDPRLIWRGPPGTHDIALGLKVIEECSAADGEHDILLPRFDKSAYNGSGDRANFEPVRKPDILLFEGWFVGVKSIAEECFDNCPHPIVEPKDIQFAKDNNKRLEAYVSLWDKLDKLIILYPEDYRLSQQWRKDAERKAIAKGKAGMSDQEIDRFVEYFWQALHPELFIKPLLKSADLVVEIKSDRSLGRIYRNE
ncbi:MAG: glycerate kinase [Cyanobacteria bacterium P01_G01_bin.19]